MIEWAILHFTSYWIFDSMMHMAYIIFQTEKQAEEKARLAVEEKRKRAAEERKQKEQIQKQNMKK